MKAITNLVARVDREGSLWLPAQTGTLVVNGDVTFSGEYTGYTVKDKKVDIKPTEKKYLVFESATIQNFENRSSILIIPPGVKGKEMDEDEWNNISGLSVRSGECETDQDCYDQFGDPGGGMIWSCEGERCLAMWNGG